MAAGDVYGTSTEPADIRPSRMCHSVDHTFIQLPTSSTVPNDVPVLVEAAPGGDRTVNYTYDAPSRIYRIDGVANEYALVTSSGKNSQRMRVQRLPASTQAHRGK